MRMAVTNDECLMSDDECNDEARMEPVGRLCQSLGVSQKRPAIIADFVVPDFVLVKLRVSD
jgi:hypothetical protein